MKNKMTLTETELSLQEVFAEAEAIGQDAETFFAHLNGTQLNWKPSDNEWSVGQCLDHLIVTNRQYFPDIEQVIAGTKKQTFWQSMPLLPKFFGRLLLKFLSPESKRKIKAPAVFRPSSSSIDSGIVRKFVEHQKNVVDLIRRTEERDLDHIIIDSPVTKIITYSLLDLYRIIVVHERRHFRQAQRVMQSPGFPG